MPNPAAQSTANPAEIDGRASQRWLKQHKALAGRLPLLTVLSGALAGGLLIGQALLLARIADGAMFGHQGLAELAPLLWAMLGLLLVRALLVRTTERLAFRSAAAVKLQLRDRLFRKLIRLGPAWLERQRSGELSHCLHEGIEALEAYYARYLPAVALSAFLPLAILALVLPVDWRSGLILLVTAPLIPFFMILIGKQAEQLNQQRWQQLGRMGGHFLDLIRGLTQLKLLGASRREIDTVAAISDRFRRDTLAVLRVAFLSSLALEFFATLSIALLAVTIGFRLYWGELDFATGLAVLLLAPEFYLPLRNLGTQYHARMAGVSAAQQMMTIMQAEPVEKASSSTTELAAIDTLELVNVHFAYEAEQSALKDIQLQIDRPGLYALVGPSGAGKSTLVDLLLRFIYPQQGSYRLNGTAVDKLALESIHSQLAWIPQQPQLFYGTVADNIALGNPEASAEEIEAAARQAGAAEFIRQLPEGYQTLLGEGGAGLSGGQRQRIALARAFLKQASLLILDEPTAHLDRVSEAQVQQAIQRYARDHIVLVVAHRLHTVRQAKRIWVLDGGRVIEQGDHRQLLNQQGLYARMLGATQEAVHA
ncbi:thiol reductant ABC exporter subunit CydD [Marinobacterium arenosum]|uniref:thiol reductant ABC exporter subunit CydD n=1 Tax=Marinobacterium arenosum TaxID=2862496 RepID=UPI001C98B958|nr:thiol reductant ABC exporter subunit CydD [Marinobacterium arenosum]MBY4675705.1 thiol reductant ABC exporter subunit CydD [Marinobacterium arenosum]